MPPRKEFSSISHDSFGKDGNACVVNVGVFVPCGNPFQYICTRNDVEVITHPFATARPKGERGGWREKDRERDRNAGPMCPTGQISGVYLYPAGQFWSMRQQHVTGTGNGTPHV